MTFAIFLLFRISIASEKYLLNFRNGFMAFLLELVDKFIRTVIGDSTNSRDRLFLSGVQVRDRAEESLIGGVLENVTSEISNAKTVIIISHRFQTLKTFCDEVYELKDNKLIMCSHFLMFLDRLFLYLLELNKAHLV